MSTVFLHVGQCGNQLGQAFWEEATSPRWCAGGGRGAHSKHPAHTPAARKTPSSPVSKLSPQATTAAKAGGPPQLGYTPYTLVDGTIPCVLIDTEPKVIRQTLDRRHGSLALSRRVREEFCVCDKTGRGNNWAYGYHGRKGESGEDLLGRVREAVRRVVEMCDRFSGFLMLHSIAGGTGSGMISRPCTMWLL